MVRGRDNLRWVCQVTWLFHSNAVTSEKRLKVNFTKVTHAIYSLTHVGKKKQLINYEKELILNKIKFVISRAYSLAIRQFVHHGFIKSPLELNDDIGDKSNVRFVSSFLLHYLKLRYSHRFAPFMNLREPAYIPWDQYQSISSALVTTTSMETAIQLFNTAKVFIFKNKTTLVMFYFIATYRRTLGAPTQFLRARSENYYEKYHRL